MKEKKREVGREKGILQRETIVVLLMHYTVLAMLRLRRSREVGQSSATEMTQKQTLPGANPNHIALDQRYMYYCNSAGVK